MSPPLTSLDRALDAHQATDAALTAYLVDRRAVHRTAAIRAAQRVVDALMDEGCASVRWKRSIEQPAAVKG